MKIATVSDIHGKYREIVFPKADLLIFAGDLLKNYSVRDPSYEVPKQLEELIDFNKICKDLKEAGTYQEIVVVAGNHDFCFERAHSQAKEILTHAIYLENSSATVLGKKIHGSPNTPFYGGWAFNFPDHNANFMRARAHARKCWGLIPQDTEILVTHGPPHGILDRVAEGYDVGCPWLLERLRQLFKIRLHIFGHIHYAYGQRKIDKTLFVNTAICQEKWTGFNPVPVIDLPD